MLLKRLAVLLAVSITAAGSAYYVVSNSDDIGQMTIRPLAGTIFLVRDGASIEVKDDTPLKAGDLITTDKNGSAHFRLAGSRSGYVTDGAKVAVTDSSSLDGRSGSMLMEVEDRTIVTFDGVTAEASEGSFRIDQGFGSSRVGAYSGKVSLSRPGQSTVTLNGLYEAQLAAGELPSSTKPYRAEASDPWDRERLATAIRLDQELAELGGGLAAQLDRGSSRPGLAYFGGLAGQPVPFMRTYLKRSTAELLIGFTVADNAADLKLSSGVAKAFELRDDGGQWGIVAAILESRPRPLLADLESVVVAAVGGGDGDATAPEFTLAAAAEATGEVPSTDSAVVDPGTPTEPTDPGGTDPGDGDGGGGGGGEEPPEEPNDCTSGPDCDTDDLELPDVIPGGGDPSPTPTDPPQDGGPLSKGLLDGEG